MTDNELIQLLHQKSAGELTPAEVEQIRARWTQSPELRQALVEHLQLETQLVGALSPVALDVDVILSRAAQQQKTERKPSSNWNWLIGLCLAAIACVGLYVSLKTAPPQEQVAETPSPTPAVPVEYPADALLPANLQEASAEAALATANGESPEVAQPQTPAPTVAPAAAMPKPVEIEIAANEPWSSTLSREAPVWKPNSPQLTPEFKSAGHDEFPDGEAKKMAVGG